MGVCVSFPKASKGGDRLGGSIKRPSTAQVIHMDGRVQEFKAPVQAKTIISQNPNHFLCSSESMSIGTCMPQVPDDEELQLGQIYFLMPLSEAHKQLTLRDLCSLAIKASSATAVGKGKVDFSPQGGYSTNYEAHFPVINKYVTG